MQHLIKQILDLIEETLVFFCRIWLECILVFQRFNDRLIFLSKSLRNPYGNLDVHVTSSAISVYRWKTSSAESYNLTRLCAGVNLDLVVTIQAWDRYFCSKHCVNNRNYLGIIKIIALALKVWMFCFLDDYEKISVNSIILCRMAFSLKCQLHTGLYSCRNLDLDRFAFAYQACSTTAAAWVADDLAFSTALLAG